MSRFVCLLALLVLTLPCRAGDIDLERRDYVSAAEAASLRQPVVFLDVRSTLEWLRGHVKGAVHIPYDEVPRKITQLIPDRSTPIITYCASGGRASYVVDTMRKLGYTVVPVTRGGYRELIASGMQKN
jgi:phage shock protein E